ncbi:ABC transporter ATP-binding protein [Shewanella sp. VB17]|uniref:ABC transporter ATP-binding protein n=1 Tax=Shewanella sp. VB17 TaxID=2739432 RepID=UPI0015671062|nr:ABC transporter ATP-binding protein [Shewanella sp. VB17]NRD72896.1 ABC transporter ATP-binding protein [Shewanella sp. VB17]
MTTHAPLVQLTNVSKTFIDGEQQHSVLDKISLTLDQKIGQTVALMGASGSGKSTLLNVIAGFEKHDSNQDPVTAPKPPKSTLTLLGQNTINWQDKHWSLFRQQSLGVIFQQFNLLTPLNVKDNIAFPLRLNHQNWNSWCEHLSHSLGLSSLLERHVNSLSGGQQQRVAIARALAHKPPLILADEPTGNLDQAASLEVMQLLCTLAGEHNTAILMVTHSIECANFMQQRWHIKEGKIHE